MRNVCCYGILLLGLVACQKVGVNGGASGGSPGNPSGLKAPSMTYGEVGNGGHGIKFGDKIYLYDLWEAGIEKGPKFPFSINPNHCESGSKEVLKQLQRILTLNENTRTFFNENLQKTFPGQDKMVADLSDRLSVIFALNSVLAMSLYESIQAHNWIFTDVELNNLRLPHPVHKLSDGEVLLLANRVGRFIYLFNKSWVAMDLWNQVGLILHEAIYSLLPPQKVMLAGGRETLRQDGRRARQILSVLSGVRSFSDLRAMGLVSFIESDGASLAYQ